MDFDKFRLSILFACKIGKPCLSTEIIIHDSWQAGLSKIATAWKVRKNRDRA